MCPRLVDALAPMPFPTPPVSPFFTSLPSPFAPPSASGTRSFSGIPPGWLKGGTLTSAVPSQRGLQQSHHSWGAAQPFSPERRTGQQTALQTNGWEATYVKVQRPLAPVIPLPLACVVGRSKNFLRSVLRSKSGGRGKTRVENGNHLGEPEAFLRPTAVLAPPRLCVGSPVDEAGSCCQSGTDVWPSSALRHTATHPTRHAVWPWLSSLLSLSRPGSRGRTHNLVDCLKRCFQKTADGLGRSGSEL